MAVVYVFLEFLAQNKGKARSKKETSTQVSLAQTNAFVTASQVRNFLCFPKFRLPWLTTTLSSSSFFSRSSTSSGMVPKFEFLLCRSSNLLWDTFLLTSVTVRSFCYSSEHKQKKRETLGKPTLLHNNKATNCLSLLSFLQRSSPAQERRKPAEEE